MEHAILRKPPPRTFRTCQPLTLSRHDAHRRYCAELVAACLQHGGLMSRDSKTGSATPHSLYKMYKSAGAMQANPYTLRQQFGMNSRTVQSLRQLPHGGSPTRAIQSVVAHPSAFEMNALVAPRQASAPVDRGPSRARSDSPPRMQFRVIQARGATSESRHPNSISLSLSSLSMNRTH